jgi:hypothetical protein
MTGDFGFPGTLLALTALPERFEQRPNDAPVVSCSRAKLSAIEVFLRVSERCRALADGSGTALRPLCLCLAASCFQRSSRIPEREGPAT